RIVQVWARQSRRVLSILVVELNPQPASNVSRVEGRPRRRRRSAHIPGRRSGPWHFGDSPMRVLLIDDNAPLVHALRMAMSGQGLAVDVAGDGKSAACKAGTADYDVIILDMDLPDEGGLGLLKRWRGEGNKSHVLVLTARADAEDRVAALNLG